MGVVPIEFVSVTRVGVRSGSGGIGLGGGFAFVFAGMIGRWRGMKRCQGLIASVYGFA